MQKRLQDIGVASEGWYLLRFRPAHTSSDRRIEKIPLYVQRFRDFSTL
jgi:hypothetical protein